MLKKKTHRFAGHNSYLCDEIVIVLGAMKVCISIPLKNRLQITISVITVLFWPNITLLKCKYRKVYINICSNRLLLPSNPYTPSGKNCNNWNCNYRNTNNLQKSLVVSKTFRTFEGSIAKASWWSFDGWHRGNVVVRVLT